MHSRCKGEMKEMDKIHALMAWMDELVINENRDERELFSVWQNLQGELMRHFGYNYSERNTKEK